MAVTKRKIPAARVTMQLMTRIWRSSCHFENALKDNPNLYDTHVKYISKLRECRLWQRARVARQAMQQRFPLTEALWLEWLANEIGEAGSQQDIDDIAKLFELAVDDYLSVDLWIQYLDFLVTRNPEVRQRTCEGVALYRHTAERALAACGLHMKRGIEIWNAILRYEELVEESLDGGDEREKQRAHIRTLFQRQLQVPLMSDTKRIEVYENWEKAVGGQKVPVHVYHTFQKAEMMVDVRRKCEEAVDESRSADADLLAAYLAYIKVEESSGNPARVQCLYERALAVFPVTHALWLQYGTYLEKHLKPGPVFKSVCLRSVRNCPWVGALWAQALRTMERSGASADEFDALYQKALQTGLQGHEDYLTVILTRIDWVRRTCNGGVDRLRKAFSEGAKLMELYFPDWWDRTHRLVGYWADCECSIGGGIAAARDVWEAALKKCGETAYETWACYILMERKLENTAEARKLYQRGHSRVHGPADQLRFCHDWLRFEREAGSAEDYSQAHQKVVPIIATIEANQYAAYNQQQADISESALQKAPKLSKKEKHQVKWEERPSEESHPEPRSTKKRKIENVGGDSKSMPPPPPRKVQRKDQQKQTGNKLAGETRVDGIGPVELDGTSHGHSHSMTHQNSTEGQKIAQGAKSYFSDNLTVYVRGITMDTEDPQLEDLFRPCGHLKEIRHMRNPSGTSRGYAYVEFESKEGVEKAVALNGKMLNGKKLFVALSKPTRGPNAVRVAKASMDTSGTETFTGGGRGRGRGRGRLGPVSLDGGRGRGRNQHAAGSMLQTQEDEDDGPKTNEQLRKLLLG